MRDFTCRFCGDAVDGALGGWRNCNSEMCLKHSVSYFFSRYDNNPAYRVSFTTTRKDLRYETVFNYDTRQCTIWSLDGPFDKLGIVVKLSFIPDNITPSNIDGKIATL